MRHLLPGPQRLPAPPLTRAAEWSFARWVRGLYAPAGPEAGWEPETPLEPIAGLAGSGADRPIFHTLLPVIAAGTWKFLARNGGYRRSDVIVSNRKRTGRLWDEAVWGNEPLRFGPATFFWLAGLHDALCARAADPRTERGVSHDVRRTLLTAASFPLTPGDRLALSIALLPLARDPENHERFPAAIEELAAKLPLLGLSHPRWLGSPTAWKFGDDERESLAVQYLDEYLVAIWVRMESFHRRRTALDQRILDTSLVRAFEGLFLAATPATHDHLLVPLTRFFPVLWREQGGMETIAKAITRISAGLSSQTDREALEAGFGAVLQAGVRLDARGQDIASTPWADRTESQKRLAAEYETHYRPVRDEVRLLARRLCRELG